MLPLLVIYLTAKFMVMIFELWTELISEPAVVVISVSITQYLNLLALKM